MKLICAILSLLMTALLYSGAAAGDIPAWMRQAASVQIPAYENEVPAVTLLNEQHVTLGSDGKLVTVENYAVKLLNKEGREHAIARAFYFVSTGKIREIEGWLLRPDGSIKNYDKKTVLDIIADPDDVYNEGRLKIIDASREVEPGYIFGYTVVSEDLPLFYQDNWFFQNELPTITSRYSLDLPPGWTASSITFNAAEVKPQVNASSYAWEMRNLPAIRKEPLSPSFRNIIPRIAVNYAPADANQGANRAFADWLDVSRWAASLYDPQVVINDEIAIKAKELTAGATTELEKIQAIGSFVQNMQYISIDIGVGHGNGYKPRPSNLVLSRGYGDCKDKANLMRAMLQILNIEAYPIAIYSGDPNYVRREWASPRQFNHAIIAVKVSDGTSSPTVINHEKLGRLLIFDATDQFTPVGDLPDYLQGSLALIIAGENGSLVEMPVTPPDFNAWNRETEVSLAEDGSIKGVIRERARGQESRFARTMYRSLSNSDFNKSIEQWLTRGATAARLIKLSPLDKQADAAFEMDVEFAAPRYGQLMQGRLLVFKPTVASRTNSIVLTEKTRKHPVMLESNSFNEKVTFTLPQGFAVDEVPDPVILQTAFGKYSTTYIVQENKLMFTRSLTTTRSTVPAERYNEVREFFTKMLEAEQSPVVLLRK